MTPQTEAALVAEVFRQGQVLGRIEQAMIDHKEVHALGSSDSALRWTRIFSVLSLLTSIAVVVKGWLLK